MNNCQKFEPAICSLEASLDEQSDIVTLTATITDNGGCSFFTDQGYCYSFFSNPSMLDSYSETEVIASQTENTSFSWTHKVDIPDTSYFFVAYVKTNAGIGYSNIVEVKTPLDK